MKTAEEHIKSEIEFMEDRTKNVPFVITILECKILMESYAKEVAEEQRAECANQTYCDDYGYRIATKKMIEDTPLVTDFKN